MSARTALEVVLADELGIGDQAAAAAVAIVVGLGWAPPDPRDEVVAAARAYLDELLDRSWADGAAGAAAGRLALHRLAEALGEVARAQIGATLEEAGG